jgi:hypothetical protein
VSQGVTARGQTEAETLLAIWEQGLAHASFARADAMLRHFEPAAALPSLGVRNRRLLELHARLFGDEIDLTAACPACQAAAQFSSRCSALIGDPSDEPSGVTQQFETDAYVVEFRLPTRADVALAAGDDDDFARRLIDRCVVTATKHGASIRASELPDHVLDEVSRRMEALDPLALVTFGVECPECATQWNAPLDIDQLLWTRVRAAAERLLLDVDMLARTYGWTEQDVLMLTASRRAAYLQLAGA